MNIQKTVQNAINSQIQHELHSAYIYLGMAAYFEAQNLKGFSAWMQKQAKEEVGHAMRFFNFVVDRGGQVELAAIDKPSVMYTSPKEAFATALSHEQKVTTLIHGLVDTAAKEKDHATMAFLKWFVDEQVEEEAQAQDMLQKLQLAGENTSALLFLDGMAGKRE